jgi:hypothetical protein
MDGAKRKTVPRYRKALACANALRKVISGGDDRQWVLCYQQRTRRSRLSETIFP